VNPLQNWSAQYSISRIKSPEALQPDHDQQRMTASLMYNRPLHNGNWANTVLWGRTRDLLNQGVLNGYLAESTLQFANRHYVWTRIENVDRTNELFVGENPEPRGFEERFLARVQAYTTGYDRDFTWIPRLATALGGQITWYSKPASLTSIYGNHPLGVTLFLRIRPFGANH
jgi:hypothetical protein